MKPPQIAWSNVRSPQSGRSNNITGPARTNAMWVDRMPGEGREETTDKIPDAHARFFQAEQDPDIQQQLVQIWNVNAQHQQQIAYRILHGERLPGIYRYFSNRRPS